MVFLPENIFMLAFSQNHHATYWQQEVIHVGQSSSDLHKMSTDCSTPDKQQYNAVLVLVLHIVKTGGNKNA